MKEPPIEHHYTRCILSLKARVDKDLNFQKKILRNEEGGVTNIHRQSNSDGKMSSETPTPTQNEPLRSI